ncbi:retrovirus-related pol polyprotein from transposon TNT 1-94 [Tanacetum coccineum]
MNQKHIINFKASKTTGKEHGRIILNSILNEQLVYGTIKVDGVTRTKTYEELSYQKKLQDDCDVRDNNIVLQGLPPDVYSLVNHHDVVKDIWDRVRLLMQGIKLSQQKRKCKMYNEFDRFTSVKGKLLHEYYLRFTQLIKAMHAIGMTMQQVQVNTKFLNRDDPISSLNNAMTFISTSIASHYLPPTTNSGHLPIQETKLPSRMTGLQFSKCRGDRLIFLLVRDLGAMLQVQGAYDKAIHSAKKAKEFRMVQGKVAANCDEASGAKAVLIANLYSYDSDAISEICIILTFNPTSDIEITSDINIISYDQYLKETKGVVVHNTTSIEQQNAMLMFVIDDITNQLALVKAMNLEHKTVNETLSAELERYKEWIKQFEDRQNIDLNDHKKYIDSQMNDMIRNYAKLNKLSEHFGKHFVPQKKLSVEQAFWLPISNPISEQLVVQPTPVKIEVPHKLPKLKEKDTTISNLKKYIADLEEIVFAELVNNSRLNSPGMNKIDLYRLPSILRKNKEVHEDYLKITKEHTNILYGIIERARALEPSNNALDFVLRPVATKTKNRNRQVTFKEKHDTSATTTQRQTALHTKQTTNKPLLPSTGVISSTSVSRSQSKSNTRKNRILPAASSNKKNKTLEVNPMKVIQIVLWYLDSGCSEHMTRQRSQLINFVDKFMGTVRFGNDQIIKIMGYVGEARSCLRSTTLKYEKDHLCYACSLGKSKKHSHKPYADDTIQEKLYMLHMDLCGPMRVESINGKKYILVITDDYSRFTWVKLLRLKDENPEVIIKRLKQTQVRLNATVRNIQTDNGIEFVNQTLKSYYKDVEISHQTLVARTPQQNDVVKRKNRNLVEAARTMLIFSKAPFRDLGKLKPKADIGLVQNHASLTPYVLPTKNDWDILFQLMLDEYVNPQKSIVSTIPIAAAPRPADPTGTPLSTSINQNAPSEGVEEQLQPAQFDNDPF